MALMPSRVAGATQKLRKFDAIDSGGWKARRSDLPAD